ncbi:cytochrome p450 superfamily protein [Acanthamoeba castellanii str. Neff]|uniref:Cytochrome p450 superfamily protein n=1 Tax=Acanthamoeba castellanii (strain ATCC 30010 / Neff) TaxID=1257118 RepID=L8HGX6_ACACF|nr:cytochrome p450 superfamily protein [Acanthamoeba castellanii str. Neff]ELR24819.1 cytochrome p450 superfamily protein [Acanthamoeba castellanii str. Neff]
MFLYLALLGAVLVLSTIFILRKTPSYSSTTTSTATTTEDGAVPPEPPRVPFWVPFVGNALAFGRDSQGYLQQCQKTYGDAFRLKMMGQDYVFVLDPFSFPNVFREEKKNLSFIAIVREFACKCFGASWDEFEKQNHETVHKQFITYLQGVELPALTARMREHLERAVKEKTQPQLLRADTSTEWQDGHMWRFVMEVLYVAGTRAFFGDTFDVEQSFKDFFAFDDNFPAFTIGVPDILLRKSVKARQRMNDLLVHLTDPTASKLMVERERYLAEETSIPPNQISRLQFATFWAAHGNTLPSYILSDKRAKQEITEEVFALFNKKDTGRETFAKLKDMVKLESAINEALRLSSASIIVREVMNDFTLKMQNGDQFHVKHGQKVAMYPYIIHNNPEVYDKPHVYQFDRFLADECQDDDDDYAHLKFVPSTKVPGNMERVESADVLHLKQRELRQLRESRRRERDLRESRTIHTSAATTAASASTTAAAPAVDADLNVDDTVDDPQDLRESREQTMRDLRASGRLFSLILRESGVTPIPTAAAAGEGETEVVGAPGKEESSSPPKKPQFTLGDKLRQREKEDGNGDNNDEHEQEERLTTPTSKRSLRFPGAPTLQEQLSSSGEVDLASPLFLRRAQRMQRRYDAEDEGNDSDSGSSPAAASPKRPKHTATTATTTSPSLPLIQVDNIDFSSEPVSLSSAGEQAKSEEEKSEVEETKPALPPFKAGSGLRRSKQLLQIAANNRRDRSVSLGVVPQLSVDVAPTAAAGSDQSGQPGVDNDSNTTGADLPPGAVRIAEALAFQPVATSASTSTAGLASPRISREQHLMFKKRERTGSFNIPGDPRLQQRAKEKKFYYKGRELRYHLMPFGGGAGMCPGRFFARNELKLFVAVMIYYFDLELVPNEQGEIKLPPLDETRLGIGILPPAKDLPFRFRLREEHLADFAAPQEKQQS